MEEKETVEKQDDTLKCIKDLVETELKDILSIRNTRR